MAATLTVVYIYNNRIWMQNKKRFDILLMSENSYQFEKNKTTELHSTEITNDCPRDQYALQHYNKYER